MPPRVRGRGKGPMRGGPSSAGPSHRRTPSASLSSSDSHDMWGQPYEPTRHSISLSSLPSFRPSFGPFAPNEPEHPHHSDQSHHSLESYHSHHSLQSHSFHHSDSPYSSGQFNPAYYVNDFLGYKPLGPEDHFSQEMEMDDHPDPEMQTGTPSHPISISSGSPFQGSPYRGPDSFQERMGTYDWFFTPSYYSSPAQPPLEDPQLQAVSPPPLPVEEPPQPPPEPPRRRRNARMSVRGGPRFSSPRGSSSYPPIPEDPQLGGPSNAAPEANPPQASYAPPQPPVGFDNPIPTYPDPSGYNPYENPSGYPSDYHPEMAGSDEANSHPAEGNTRINITGAELQALITAAVSQAVEAKFKEPSVVRSQTLSKTHSQPHTHRKSESLHSSNQGSVPKKQVVPEPTLRHAKGCTYKYFVSCKPRDFTGEKGAIDCMKWLDEMETVIDISGCAKENVVMFVSQSFKGDALTWWKALVQSTGKVHLYNLSWEKFVDLVKDAYCPQHEVERVETDFLTLVMKDLDLGPM
ncbi:extensin-like [Helianthus annuus]|uniref:extensin-like n=1 Tax=Helianthus annuus TaxID=4232 RepID=UPI000B8FC42C|nr:extensin-like [Helianthus annuus]